MGKVILFIAPLILYGSKITEEIPALSKLAPILNTSGERDSSGRDLRKCEDDQCNIQLTSSPTEVDVQQQEYPEDSRSLIMEVISQLSKGHEMHRISFPTFVLEPRSMLERITDFMSHPELLFRSSKATDKIDRFLGVVKYFLSGWHIRPKGVKKPYNPALGEYYRCRWDFEDKSNGFYIAEQVCHHPPISAYFFANIENGVVIMGNIKPKGRFLGNSVMSMMQGSSHIFLTHYPKEEYVITNPNIYARGVLLGSMFMELGDSANITCEETNLECTINFLVKGYFTGEYNAIRGKIKEITTGKVLYELSGRWTDQIFIELPGKLQKSTFLDVSTLKVTPHHTPPIHNQDPLESRRLWEPVTNAIKKRDFRSATDEKIKIEDKQRSVAQLRENEDLEWRPKFFHLSQNNFWEFVDTGFLRKNPDGVRPHIIEAMNQHFGHL